MLAKIRVTRAARLFVIYQPMISLFCDVVVAPSPLSFLNLPIGNQCREIYPVFHISSISRIMRLCNCYATK